MTFLDYQSIVNYYSLPYKKVGIFTIYSHLRKSILGFYCSSKNNIFNNSNTKSPRIHRPSV